MKKKVLILWGIVILIGASFFVVSYFQRYSINIDKVSEIKISNGSTGVYITTEDSKEVSLLQNMQVKN